MKYNVLVTGMIAYCENIVVEADSAETAAIAAKRLAELDGVQDVDVENVRVRKSKTKESK